MTRHERLVTAIYSLRNSESITSDSMVFPNFSRKIKSTERTTGFSIMDLASILLPVSRSMRKLGPAAGDTMAATERSADAKP